MPPVLNMPELRIWQGCRYARVTKGAEYAWISLSIPLKCLNVCEYALIKLNMIDYACIYLHRVLNMPQFWICLMLYIYGHHECLMNTEPLIYLYCFAFLVFGKNGIDVWQKKNVNLLYSLAFFFGEFPWNISQYQYTILDEIK